MNVFNSLINSLLSAYSAAVSWAPAAAGFAVIAALTGVVMLLVFRKLSDQERIGAAKRKVQAHLLELRIFRDEPAVMWRAQGALMKHNLRYLGLMLQPALVLALPVTLLLVHLDAFYGRAPLEIGQPAIVTLAMSRPLDPAAPPPQLIAPAGVAVETPAVRALDLREVSWRIRPLRPVSGKLQFVVNGRTVVKDIEAGPGARFVPGRRVSSAFEGLWHPDEPLIAAPGIEWIDIRHPESSMRLFGVGMDWTVWFFVLAMVAALLLKKPLRVTF
jgi:uncharacterized membrane protein (DUF106 family)